MDSVRKLNDTNLDTIVVSKNDLGSLYPEIGGGCEGQIYRYSKDIIIKRFSLFRAMEYFYSKELTNKFNKLEKLCLLKDESFCFPLGLVGFESLEKEGCFMRFIETDANRKDFKSLEMLEDRIKIIEYLTKADQAIRRIHEAGVYLGDIKEENILIDLDGNPIFIDTDNYAYDEFGFDLEPYRSQCIERMFGTKANLKDNDIFVFSMMALKLLFKKNEFCNLFKKNVDFYSVINSLPYTQEVKDGLMLIFSDSQNKPYIGPILKKMI